MEYVLTDNVSANYIIKNETDTTYGHCRCCLEEGNHRDITKSYIENGKRELYGDIFLDCFNLFLSTNMNLSTLICTSCVDRLRSANEFKQLVMQTEQQLMAALQDCDTDQVVLVNVPVPEETLDTTIGFKIEVNDDDVKPLNLTDKLCDFEDCQVEELLESIGVSGAQELRKGKESLASCSLRLIDLLRREEAGGGMHPPSCVSETTQNYTMGKTKDKNLNILNEEGKMSTPTDIEKIYSRNYNFNDFLVVFDYKNEYKNSLRDMHMFRTEKNNSILQDQNLSPDKKKETSTMAYLGNKVFSMKHNRQLVNVGFDYTTDTAKDLYCYKEVPASVDSNFNNSNVIDPYVGSDDSCEDQDYYLETDPNNGEVKVRTEDHNLFQLMTPKDLSKVNKSTDNCLSEPALSIQHCEYANCLKEVYSVCRKCFCLLCFPHFDDEISYNECQQHKPYNHTNKALNATLNENTTSNMDKIVFQNEKPSKGLTKDGNPRKRNKFEEPLLQRKEKKAKLRIEKLDLKEPCREKCIKKCTSKVNEEQRIKIHNEYVSLNWEARALFMKGLVESKNIARKTIKTKRERSIRNIVYTYFFYLDNEKIEVCKTFFLTTLGYNAKNDRRLHYALKKPADQQKDQRGKYVRSEIIDKEIIIADIKTYKPSNFHYRRDHAPLRQYLPSDLTISEMHDNFCKTYPNLKVSYETYKQVLHKNMNISFAHLRNEECEVCAHYKQHAQRQNDSDTSCFNCENFKDHKLRYTQSRKEYKSDVKKSRKKNNTNICFYSVDLQKIIMLPRMEKTEIICPRIIAYNESFVPLGSSKKDNIPFAAIWNESTSGRKQEDIISTLRAFFLYKRDKQHIILWMDNWSYQNKNWALFSFLIDIINSDLIATETVTLKYFEPGHTFMSANSFHHHVEQYLQEKGNVYDFKDFIDAVTNSQEPNEVKVMEVSHFYNYSDLSSQHKVHKLKTEIYLRDIMVILAKRGRYTLDFKKKHEDDEFETLDFLQLKYIQSQSFPNVKARTLPRGVRESTKTAILEKLVHLMPGNRKSFWLRLPVSTGTDVEDDPNDE